ncbi:molybdenum ABC transporter ATP-binding protein [Paracoccus albus]|uniref:molybdenum ABC transporter ATP-binding protein n=1 Tax=Paracoccus albus TaxID=3017784 RepID=UPI0022F0C377|nr:molybdenum ABC transporter ATP-binding protein [Paracoccus albus]WBU61583.1 molybdenum ABC transporter ATP-binding protein [Paracoccus albus]
MTLSAEIRHGFPDFSLDVRFRAGKGVTALFGRSGAGKSTIINAIAGLLRADHARIVLDGNILADGGKGIFLPPHRRRIGYVFQDARLFPHLSVRANLDYGRRFAPKSERAPEARFREVVEILGIHTLLERRPGALSGGERQRVALGRAILSAPKLLLLDEPLAALDEARKAEILPYLEALRDIGLPILYVSHSASEISRLASHVVMIEKGRVIASGSATDVLSDPLSALSLGQDAGAVLTAQVVAQDADGLARLSTAAGPIWVAKGDLRHGMSVRLRILAREVMLATAPPQGISALNVLTGTVDRVENEQSGSILVRVKLAEDAAILSRITARSCRTLEITPGKRIHAILKSVSIADVAAG